MGTKSGHWTRHGRFVCPLCCLTPSPLQLMLFRKPSGGEEGPAGSGIQLPAVTSSPHDPRSYELVQLANGLLVGDPVPRTPTRSRKPQPSPSPPSLPLLSPSISGLNPAQVLLVSDPEAGDAAGALDVSVGSMADPVDHQGLAHFLEHMLFLGSTKYPGDNEYSAYSAHLVDPHWSACAESCPPRFVSLSHPHAPSPCAQTHTCRPTEATRTPLLTRWGNGNPGCPGTCALHGCIGTCARAVVLVCAGQHQLLLQSEMARAGGRPGQVRILPLQFLLSIAADCSTFCSCGGFGVVGFFELCVCVCLSVECLWRLEAGCG
jgi:hypothetical protein